MSKLILALVIIAVAFAGLLTALFTFVGVVHTLIGVGVILFIFLFAWALDFVMSYPKNITIEKKKHGTNKKDRK